MKNLVSKNPVLRFKLGRKIEKFEGGGEPKPWAGYYTVGNWPKTAKKEVVNNTKGITPAELAKFNRNYPYDKYATSYRLASPDFPATIQDARFGDYSGERSGLVADLEMGNFDWLPRKVRVPYVPTLKSQKTEVKNVKTPGAKTKNTKKTVYPQTKFMGVVRGGNVINFNNAINSDLKAKLIASGSFTNADFANTTTFLNALNRYFGKDGLGSVVADGMWGNQTLKAFDMAMQKVNSPIVNTTEGIKFLGERPSLVPKVNLDVTTAPRIKMPESPVNLGYRTSNTYEGNDFYNRMRNMGITSNANLIDFMHRTNGENYNWNGDDWARQFRSDVNQALGGDYSDANIRKVFNTAGNWHKGFLGRGDLGDFQNVLQTHAGAWNGEYDRNLNNYIKNGLGNYVKNIDWTKFKLFKQGGLLLPSKNPVIRFRNRNFK